MTAAYIWNSQPAADPWGFCDHGLPPAALCLDCEGVTPADPPADDLDPDYATGSPGDESGGTAGSGKRGPSVATRLVKYALDHHTLGWAADGSGPFAVAHGSHLALPLRSGRNSLRGTLARAAHDRLGITPSATALADAMTVLEGYAAQDSAEAGVHLRVAFRDGAIWLDLGDDHGRAVRITPDCWTVVDQAPVIFRRSELTGVLPVPERGGDLAELWRFANVRPDLRPLLLGWLVASLLPDRPCPVCALLGEQGTGKSTATRLLGGLLDPSPAATRKPPRDIEAWVTAAAGSRVVAIDNLSGIPEWFSDSLCRAVTGDADVRRTLYTDGGLTVFAFRRAIVVNGIDLGAVRPDLGDRLLPIALDRIAEADRIAEQDLPALWAAAWPKVLGAVLDLAAQVLADLAREPRPDRLPRMADFGRILHAIDRITGSAAVGTYARLGDEMAGDTVNLDPVLAALVAEVRAPWSGTASDLFHRLDQHRPTPIPRDWPKSARGIASHLTRHAPSLRRLGWTVEKGKDPRGKLTEWALIPPAPFAGVARVAGVVPVSTPANGAQARQTPHNNTAGQATNGRNGADIADVADVRPPPTLLVVGREVEGAGIRQKLSETTPATPATPAMDCADPTAATTPPTRAPRPPATTHSHPPDLLDLGDLDQTTGPCAICGNPTHRYGDGGSPLCDRCGTNIASPPTPDQPQEARP